MSKAGIATSPNYERIELHLVRANNTRTVISGPDWPTVLQDCGNVAANAVMFGANPPPRETPTPAKRPVSAATKRKLAEAGRKRWAGKAKQKTAAATA